MKKTIHKMLTTACTLALLGGFTPSFADIPGDAERLFNWAEATYPDIFPTHKTSASDGPWIFRSYSETGVIAGVNTTDNNVYVKGGTWGNTPVVLGSLTALMVKVDITSNTERLLNWAEATYPGIFTKHKASTTDGTWIYRNYNEDGILAGVNINDNNVYVQGGPWGNTPVSLGSLAALLAQIDSNPNSSEICNTAALPAGMTVTQSGNTINVSTNGNCIVPPTDQNYCAFAVPAAPQVTGINVLTTGAVTKMELKGLTGGGGIFDNLLQTGLDYKTCVINAPADEMAGLTINTNVCYDLTETFKDVQSVPGFITKTNPVLQTLNATATTTRVADCFATNADSVSNLVTGENWIKTNGAWSKLPNTP